MKHNSWLSELYIAHRRMLLLVAWNITEDRALAEDAVHSAIVKLAQLAAVPDEPRAYALQVVRNMAIDTMRIIKRRQESPHALDQLSSPLVPNDDMDERQQHVEAALASLEPEYREAVRLHLHGGLTFREIGELTGVPLQTVATRYRRALNQLRTLIESQHDFT